MILKIHPDSPLAPLAGQRVKLGAALILLPGTQLKGSTGKNQKQSVGVPA